MITDQYSSPRVLYCYHHKRQKQLHFQSYSSEFIFFSKNVRRYFFLICFATYAVAEAKSKFAKTFVAFMDEHKELRDLIAKGMDSFAWA